jgi:hypothetical protein
LAAYSRRPPVAEEPARHRFYRDHRGAAAALLAAVVLADAGVTARLLRPVVFHDGLAVAGAVTLYFALVHTPIRRLRVPKEVATALLFTIGTLLVPWAVSAPARRALVPAGLVFFLLCLANLVAIETWETGGGAVRALGRKYIWWVPALVPAALVLTAWPFGAAAALSAAAMTVLFACSSRLDPDARRALVDAALLAPLIFVLAGAA